MTVATYVQPVVLWKFPRTVEVVCAGKPDDWRLGQMSEQPSDEQKRVLSRILALAGHYGAHSTLSMSPAFTTDILYLPNFTRSFSLPRHAGELRKPNRDVVGDVIEVPPGYAGSMASGDCPAVIALHEPSRKMFMAHAGRDCLVDRALIDTGKPARRNASVVDTIIKAFDSSGIDPAEVRVAIVLGISAEHFPHPWSSEAVDDHTSLRNRRMVEHIMNSIWFSESCLRGRPEEGRLNLAAIITQQFMFYGVPRSQITSDGRDTFSDHRWHSNRRGDRTRNCVLVVNR